MPIDFEIQQGLPFVFTNLPNLVTTTIVRGNTVIGNQLWKWFLTLTDHKNWLLIEAWSRTHRYIHLTWRINSLSYT